MNNLTKHSAKAVRSVKASHHNVAHIKKMDKGFHVRTHSDEGGREPSSDAQQDEYEGAHPTMASALKAVRANFGETASDKTSMPDDGGE